MCVALVGGMDRLKRDYEGVAKQFGVRLKLFTGKEACLMERLGSPDMAVLCTRMVSHNAKTEVVQRSRTLGIPVRFLNTNGVSGLRTFLTELITEGQPGVDGV